MKLTYTKSDLSKMLKSVPYWNFPRELLNSDQQKLYDGMKMKQGGMQDDVGRDN